jgi:hypothetical protein
MSHTNPHSRSLARVIPLNRHRITLIITSSNHFFRIKTCNFLNTGYSLSPPSAACFSSEHSAAGRLSLATLFPVGCLCWWQFGETVQTIRQEPHSLLKHSRAQFSITGVTVILSDLQHRASPPLSTHPATQ